MEGSTPAIAVIGMGCWYPGASDLRTFWENVLARRQQFRRFPDQRLPMSEYYDPAPRAPDKTYATRGAYIDGFEFDWAGRRVPKKTFESTDVIHWLALEVALRALSDAGHSAETVPAERSAVILGNSLTGEQSRANYMRLRWPYVRKVLRAAAQARELPHALVAELEETMEETYKSVFPPINEDTLAGTMSNTIAGRICNFLDFHGGGYTVDGACASGMIAVATAASALTNRDIDFALAGGADISLDTMELIGFAKVGALTREEMNVYDKRGSGFIPGEGCGFVALKRLEDARADGDYVYAVIRGWGISTDGKGGLTAPSKEGQATMLRRAYARAGYSMREILFVEGHGTATVAGDRAELEAIQMALSADTEPEPRSCGMTSFKSLIGHTKAASGIGGLIKAVMAVNRRVLPPTAGCKEPNAVFATFAHALYPNLQGEIRQPGERIRAGASAMGFGGINCHVAIESADPPSPGLEPSIEERALVVSNQETELFVLGAASIPGLLRRVQDLARMAAGLSVAEMTDLAAHLSRDPILHSAVRGAIVAGTAEELGERLAALETMLNETPPGEGEVIIGPRREFAVGNAVRQTRVGFLFPGQGSQQLNMARALVERFDWGRELVDRADVWLQEAGSDPVGDRIYRRLDRAINRAQVDEWSNALAQTEVSQPAICLASLLWLRYLDRLGIRPSVVAGHSLGELTALHAAGAFDEQALIRLAAVRGLAMAASGDEAGTMASLSCSRQAAEEIVKRVQGYATVANINSPTQVVISGERPSVEEAIALAEAEGIKTYQLKVSNAFHSRLVSEASERLRRDAPVPESLENTAVPVYSGVDASEIEPGTNLREHVARQVVARVDFVGLIERLDQECDLFLEVGPGRVLSGLVNGINGPQGVPCLPVASESGLDRDLNVVLANLFVRGSEIRWEAFYERRLIRPFVPASERIFIENPVERPLTVPETEPSRILPSAVGSTESELARSAQISEEALADYLAQRGKFLAEVVRADLASLPALKGAGNGLDRAGAADGHAVSRSLATDQPQPDAFAASGGGIESIEVLLIQLVAEQTGFPRESIPPEARLLDDLNLDSIKAGELVATAARECSAAGDFDPSMLANATLREVAEALSGAGGQAGARAPETVTTQATIPNLLLEIVEQTTGFPRDSLSLDLRLLDDLNLDSIKSAELVAEVANRLGVAQDGFDPSVFANATLAEVAGALQEISSGTSAPVIAHPAAETTEADRPSWVRTFAVEYEAEELGSEERARIDWQAASALILYEPGETDLAAAVSDALSELGAQTRTVVFAEAREAGLIADPAFSVIVALLPRSTVDEAAHRVKVQRAIERLRTAAIPPDSGGRRPATTVAFVQFGGGYFGTRPTLAESAGYPGTADLERCGAAAFAASVHHERADLKVRVIDLHPGITPDTLAARLIDELSTHRPFAAVGYDADGTRVVGRPRVQEPSEYQKRAITWSSDDVILVTGGAKGITAECALALAGTTGARMALVGSSAPPAQDTTGKSAEIAATLERFRSQGSTCRYYQCDISDAGAVQRLFQQIRTDLGRVTGVVHGAGLNKSRRVEQASVDSALEEVAPKLLGALNLCDALRHEPPRLIVGFSSITGVTGMPGNAWYGFANEALDLLLRRFGAEHPETSVLSIAYSIWGEVGMGARTGSAHHLAKMGIAPIPTGEGVRRFLQLVRGTPRGYPGARQVVVAARLGGLDTWLPARAPLPAASRFLEEIVSVEPNVEVIVRAHLSLERDPYVQDHVYKGSYLFPTVFGLEAMAQAAAYALGVSELGAVRIQDVRLERPIVVDPARGVTIEIRAEVQERESESSPQQVRAAIGTEQTGFARDHFLATFVVGEDMQAPTEQVDLPAAPLDIQPREDLYPWLLFQGPRFQRLQTIYSLDVQKCIFSVSGDEAGETDGPFLLGDPYRRDALLQAPQLIIPQDICLPVSIDNIDIWPSADASPTSCIGVAFYEGRDEHNLYARVFAVNQEGRRVDSLEGYQLRILEHRADYPDARELSHPDERDFALLRAETVNRAREFGVTPPELMVAYISGLHQLSREERHQRELPLAEAILRRLTEAGIADVAGHPEDARVEWLESGKPVIKSWEGEDIGISFAHDDRICLCVAGRGAQGCDIAPVSKRSEEEWRSLFSTARQPLLRQLLEESDSLDRAGMRIWTAVEAARKAANVSELDLMIERRAGDSVLFRAGEATGGPPLQTRYQVLTFPINLTRGPERLIAVVLEAAEVEMAPAPSGAYVPARGVQVGYPGTGAEIGAEQFGYVSSTYGIDLDTAPPHGGVGLVQRFPLSFRDSANLSRTLYFSHYFDWLGKLRELSLQPINDRLVSDFATGEWGWVTNFSETRILGEARQGDVIEGYMSPGKPFGPAGATVNLAFEWRKVLPDGSREQIALSTMGTTWVAVRGHGIVEAVPFPDYAQQFIDMMAADVEDPLPRPEREVDLGTEVYRAPGGPTSTKPLLRDQIFETSLEESNSVGNIYYANYYVFQGRTRDHLFHEIAPEYFRGTGERGELRCTYCRVDHLREAMPFDNIAVQLRLDAIHERGVRFLVEYFRHDPDGQRTKLAYGVHEAAWVVPSPDGPWRPAPLPPVFSDALLGKSRERQPEGTEHLV